MGLKNYFNALHFFLCSKVIIYNRHFKKMFVAHSEIVICLTCMLCGQLEDDYKLMFCDRCDKGFHTDCLTPQRLEVPKGV